MTIKKLAVAVICGYLGGPDSGILLQVLLTVVLIGFQELLIAFRPYRAVDSTDFESQSQQSQRRGRLFVLRNAALFDCNQIERVGTFCLLVLLGCASVFQDRDCQANQGDSICGLLDCLGITIFIAAVVGCVANPARFVFFELIDRAKPPPEFVRQHSVRTGR